MVGGTIRPCRAHVLLSSTKPMRLSGIFTYSIVESRTCVRAPIISLSWFFSTTYSIAICSGFEGSRTKSASSFSLCLAISPESLRSIPFSLIISFSKGVMTSLLPFTMFSKSKSDSIILPLQLAYYPLSILSLSTSDIMAEFTFAMFWVPSNLIQFSDPYSSA